MSKLNPEVVRKIRKAVLLRNKLGNKHLAKRYGVAPQTIRNVIKKARWGWVK